MNRPTFVTVSTLVFTLVAYVTLAQTVHAGETATLGGAAVLESPHAAAR